ncbi:hypothetical protein HZS_2147 [Henneguya salminicola]|nr:hypothetical protein HZS_2147 [Henneguya salminicola]
MAGSAQKYCSVPFINNGISADMEYLIILDQISSIVNTTGFSFYIEECTNSKEKIERIKINSTFFNERVAIRFTSSKYLVEADTRILFMKLDPTKMYRLSYISIKIRSRKKHPLMFIDNIQITPTTNENLLNIHINTVDSNQYINNNFNEYHDIIMLTDSEKNIRLTNKAKKLKKAEFNIHANMHKTNEPNVKIDQNVKISIVNIKKLHHNTYGKYHKKTKYFAFFYKIGFINHLYKTHFSDNQCINLTKIHKCNKKGRVVCRDPSKIKYFPACNQSVHLCSDYPCVHDGVSKLESLLDKPYNRCICECETPYYGKYCQHKNSCNNCKKNACGTSNNCSHCRHGWSGQNCEFRETETHKICQNNGKIQITNGKIECICPTGLIGKNCEINCSYFCSSNKCTIRTEFICHISTATKISRLCGVIFGIFACFFIIIIYTVSKKKKKYVINQIRMRWMNENSTKINLGESKYINGLAHFKNKKTEATQSQLFFSDSIVGSDKNKKEKTLIFRNS